MDEVRAEAVVHAGTSEWRLDGAVANVQARWLDAADRDQRAELLQGLPSPDEHGEAAPFAWAHRTLVRDGLRICVGPAWTPTVLRLQREQQDAAEAPLLVLELLPGAHCVLVESHVAHATQNLQVHVRVAGRAQLEHLRIARPGAGAQVTHHVHVRVAEGARYAQRLVATGAAYHLQRTLVDLAGRGAQASVRAVQLAAGTLFEQQVSVRHTAAATRSDVEMLALGSGNARMVGDAFTSIAPGCDGADVRQRLAGIPTSGQPKLVLRPHLEIHHDDVQAVHGATWGALPEDALFHARQRGLDETAAKMMIVEGLARSVLSRDADWPAELEDALAAAVRGHLSSLRESRHG
jgi:Fe-S cluster assembly protein SufD